MKLTELELISELNNRLASVQCGVNQEARENLGPTTYILGCPRSGTTALLQYLANSGSWTFPTNLLTRFSRSTYIGTLVQELLFNPNYGLVKQDNCIDFTSDYGRSSGALNANEFFHFFRRFFPNNEISHLSDNLLKQVDTEELEKEIRSICQITQKPFLTKGLMLQFNLGYFFKKMPNSIFLFIKRDEEFVMQSIYKARIKESGDIKKWWSAKPKEYENLLAKSTEEQIAGQVYYTNKAIEHGLENIPSDNKLVITYEDFINDPAGLYSDLLLKYQALGFPLVAAQIDEVQSLYDANHKTLEPRILEKMLHFIDTLKEKS